MDPVRNPFAPGAGNPPPELAGRHEVLSEASTAILRIAQGRPTQSIILVGLRGVGKTVLLNRIDQIAESNNYLTIFVEAHEGKTLPELLTPGLRNALYRLSTIESAKEQARKGLRILKSFLSALKVTIEGIDVGIDPEIGTADSGKLEADLPELILAVAYAAQAAKKPIAILVDELQYLEKEEFSALVMAVHRISQKNLPFLVVGAGLPQILGLAGNSKSYAERLFRFPAVGALEEADAISAIQGPATIEGVVFEQKALDGILKITKKYPYFIQQWAYEAWNASLTETITADTIDLATKAAIDELDQSFFKVRFDRCTPAEKRYMRALAELGAGTKRSGDISEVLGVKSTSVAPTRSSLIRKGMIYSPSHGDTAFTVPLFDEYMRRAIPEFK